MTRPANLLVFELEGQRHGLAAVHVVEICPAVTTLAVPGNARGVEGIMNLRGLLVPVVDLRVSCGLPPKGAAHTDHLVVVHVEGRTVAVRVDRAIALVRGEVPDGHGVVRLGGELVYLHDPRTFLGADDCATLAALGCWAGDAA